MKQHGSEHNITYDGTNLLSYNFEFKTTTRLNIKNNIIWDASLQKVDLFRSWINSYRYGNTVHVHITMDLKNSSHSPSNKHFAWPSRMVSFYELDSPLDKIV